MKTFRKNVAIAIDGGGLRGIIVARALMKLEEKLGKPLSEVFRLTAGTSTGSILAAAIACGMPAEKIYELYQNLGHRIFKKSLRSAFWFLSPYRYPREPLAKVLYENLGDRKMGDLWKSAPSTDMVITTFDLVANHTVFIKPWKEYYQDWPVVEAVLASAAAPTYFPVFKKRYTDGGVGSYNNPCYLAAYEIVNCLKWDLKETTLISLGTGRYPTNLKTGQADRFLPIHWVSPLLDAFGQCAADEQVHLVKTLFKDLDFRRYQVDLKTPLTIDDPGQIPHMIEYGDKLGRMILSDSVDPMLSFRVRPAPKPRRK